MRQPSPTRDKILDLLRRRIVVAPMAGGPSTTDLVIAAGRAEALGFLAAGYLDSLGPGLGDASWDDDGFDGKIAALLADPSAVTSFTFGCPAAEVIRALQEAASAVVVTVTSPAEAAQAARAGADALCVQGHEAGAHRGTFVNDDAPGRDSGLLSLIGEVAGVTGLPQIAA